ncbi:MAG TPA: hypothetical protein DCM40_40690 [Maribacter sp.]|nr:hypothetical protein [Maribacter sp.]
MEKNNKRYKPGDLCFFKSAVNEEILSGSGPALVLEEGIGYANAPGYSHSPDYVYTIYWQSSIEEKVSADWLILLSEL